MLVDHALARFSSDNLSCMVVRLDPSGKFNYSEPATPTQTESKKFEMPEERPQKQENQQPAPAAEQKDTPKQEEKVVETKKEEVAETKENKPETKPSEEKPSEENKK